MKYLVLAAVAAVALSGTAHASIIPTLNGVTPDGSDFTFTYSGGLAADQGVTAGDQLVILDFAGYVDGSVHSSLANVTASVSNTLPAGLIMDPHYTDDPTIPDLVFTYNGPDYQTSGGPYPSITYFSGLSADSIFGDSTKGYFSASAVRNTAFDGELEGSATFNVGAVNVPVSAVPEPASWALMILGFLGLGTALRLQRKRSFGVAA